MIRKTMLALAGATALLSTAANAADLPPPLPAPVIQPVQVVVGGWYLRGDVGVGQKSFSDFQHNQTNPNFVWPASWSVDQKDMADTAFVGFGVGYAWNNWLRFDITGEYRMKEAFKVVGSYDCGGVRCFDVYEGHHSNWLVLANAYVDLGTWWCLTPFVGAGIGTAYHKFTGLTDVGIPTGGFGYTSSDKSSWNMAWALHAGVAYNVTNNFKVELAYRYVNMGTIESSVIDCASTGCGVGNGPRASYSFTNYYSQDIKIGMRWMLAPEPVIAAPLMRKG
jgi:opacity protein-like surface antigen